MTTATYDATTGKPHRNSPERAAMLAERAAAQRSRTAGFTPSDFLYNSAPPSEKHEIPTRMVGAPASINRRTGKPHEHKRARQRQFLASIPRPAWG